MSNERTTFDALLPDPTGQKPYMVDLVRAIRAEISDLKRIVEPLQRDKSDYAFLQALSTEAGGVRWATSGTWTPTWLGSTTNPTVTYTAQDGYYVRVGSMVFVSGRLTISAKAGGAGNLWMGGLPFTVGTNEGQRGGFATNVSFNWGGTTGPERVVPVANATIAEVFRSASADARDNRNAQLTTADLTATALLYFNGFFFTP